MEKYLKTNAPSQWHFYAKDIFDEWSLWIVRCISANRGADQKA